MKEILSGGFFIEATFLAVIYPNRAIKKATGIQTNGFQQFIFSSLVQNNG